MIYGIKVLRHSDGAKSSSVHCFPCDATKTWATGGVNLFVSASVCVCLRAPMCLGVCK